MSNLLLAAIVGIPLAWHFGVAAIVYYDTGRVPLARRKWLAITLLIPIFGFFMYLFERSELSYDPETDPFRRKMGFEVHESRADDFAFDRGGKKENDDER